MNIVWWMLWIPTVLADPVVQWSDDTFPQDGDIAGTNGWSNGYSSDPWAGTRSGNSLIPRTDDGSGSFGDGGPADNWLIRGPDLTNAGVLGLVGNLDNDAVGVVLSHDGSGSYYLLFHTADSAPEPVGSVDEPTVALLRVDGASVQVLGEEADVSDLGPPPALPLRLERRGARLTASFDGEVLFDVTDPTPLGPGRAGVWSWDTGDANGRNNDTAYFSSISYYAFDLDDDGVPDDLDVCPDLSAADQTDSDRDGLGDLCDVCPGVADPDQDDADDDGVGDACDNCPEDAEDDQDLANGQPDADADGVGDFCDNCPEDANPDQDDADNDGVGDACTSSDGGSGSDGGGPGGEGGADATDTDDRGGIPTVPGPNPFADERLRPARCEGCRTGRSGGPALILLALLAPLRRRRG